jgi:hypothetical protein
VEEALVEMYLAGVSVRRDEDITEGLLGRYTQKSFSSVRDWHRVEGDPTIAVLAFPRRRPR